MPVVSFLQIVPDGGFKEKVAALIDRGRLKLFFESISSIKVIYIACPLLLLSISWKIYTILDLVFGSVSRSGYFYSRKDFR